ncbi:hypothetical protein M2164_005867 [Streptomyces sp. SAI-208]|uniref:hypothetical protein n=1 Tax=Streptomyces sp. SAI-208 TaxID=2940550 RepID=UPI0024739A69|nr:hypothetical protein [Streptomyces sp. SAI-208]MDH6610232.1 hypothetical protein [Streptomyces sp. SAI-208]
MRALADITEDALVRVDVEAHAEFGQDETAWQPGEWRTYFDRLEAARLDPEAVA